MHILHKYTVGILGNYIFIHFKMYYLCEHAKLLIQLPTSVITVLLCSFYILAHVTLITIYNIHVDSVDFIIAKTSTVIITTKMR